MHARRARHLGEAADGILHLIGSGHHQVRQFVDENDDTRQRLFLRILFAELIIAHHIAHVIVREELIAVEHLRHRPTERARRLARIGHDGHQQVRNAVIDAQLDLLRVDHEKLYLIGARVIEDADDHRVQANGLAGARGARDEQMGHLGKVRAGDVARDILAEGDVQLAFRLQKDGRFDDLAQRYHGARAVRDFNAHGGLVRDWRFDSHAGGCKVQGDIVRKIGDAVDTHARGGLQFVARNGRAAADIHDFCLHAEAFQRVDELASVRLQLLAVVEGINDLRFFQAIIGR